MRTQYIEYCNYAPRNSIVSAVASRGRYMKSTPQLPLATPKVDPEKIIRKGKTLQEGTSAIEPGIFDNLHCPSLENPISASHSPVIPSVGVS